MRTALVERNLCRRLVALLAIGTIVLQAFVAGIGAAQSPSAPAADFSIICHGKSGASTDPGAAPSGAPDTDKSAQDCCLFCAAAAPATVQEPSTLARLALRRTATAPPAYAATVVIARARVRAGPSQAPPSPA